jgi:hypothetical protein
MLDNLDLTDIPDMATAQRVIARVLNAVEELSAELATLRAENQQLRDEVNRLKGEQAKPRILPSRRAKQDHASERERRETPKTWCKRAKLPELRIDRVEVCRLDRSLLPEDAVLKDYQEHTVQDLVLQPETILFRRRLRVPGRPTRRRCRPATAGSSAPTCRRVRSISIMKRTSANRSCTACSRVWGYASRGATWAAC